MAAPQHRPRPAALSGDVDESGNFDRVADAGLRNALDRLEGKTVRRIPRSEDAMRASLREAERLLKARKGPATEDDRPKRKSEPPQVIPGQLDLDGREAT